jgi:hypothetical protein
MRARRTVFSNKVFRMPGGNEDQDLWAMTDTDSDDDPVIRTTWVPDDEERAEIAGGSNVEVVIWGVEHPAMAVTTDDAQLGRPK